MSCYIGGLYRKPTRGLSTGGSITDYTIRKYILLIYFSNFTSFGSLLFLIYIHHNSELFKPSVWRT